MERNITEGRKMKVEIDSEILKEMCWYIGEGYNEEPQCEHCLQNGCPLNRTKEGEATE